MVLTVLYFHKFIFSYISEIIQDMSFCVWLISLGNKHICMKQNSLTYSCGFSAPFSTFSRSLSHKYKYTCMCVCVCVYTYADFPSGTVVKNPSAMQEPPETWVRSLGQEDPWKRKWQHTPIFLPGEFHRGGWQVTVPRVAKSQTQLKRLSGMCVCLCVHNTQQNWSYKQLTVV